MNFLNVKNPAWANQEKTLIKCTVDFEDIGEVPFAANPQDHSNHSSSVIFDECVAGNWGAIEDFVEPQAPAAPLPATAEQNKSTASRLLLDTDWVELPSVSNSNEPVFLTNKVDFIAYRTALRAIAVNPPAGNLTWPAKPSAVWS